MERDRTRAAWGRSHRKLLVCEKSDIWSFSADREDLPPLTTLALFYQRSRD